MYTAKPRLLPLWVSAALILSASAAQAGIFGTSGAKRDIQKLLRSPELAATNVGIKAVSLNSGKTLVGINDGKLFIPASTAKLLTAYGALKTLTPRYTFSTEFSADLSSDTVTVRTLYLRGNGDPSVTLADINAQALSLSEKVKRIAGDIVVDSSFFDPLRFGHGWMWDEGIVAWNAPIAPYTLNGNCIDILLRPGEQPGNPVQARALPATAYAVLIASATTGERDTVTIRREETDAGDRFIIEGSMKAGTPETRRRCAVSRPGLYAGTLLKELLNRYGVSIAGNVYEGTASTSSVTISRYASRSLGEVIRSFLKDSDNLTGECILKTLGAAGGTPPGNAEKGIAAIKGMLREIGIDDKTYVLADGSGLSTYNQLSPDILVRLLAAAYGDFSLFPEFLDALPAAGADGTLKNRLKDRPWAPDLRAKTGSMTGVSCTAGYLKTRKGDTLAFAIMMNGCSGATQSLRTAQDEIIALLREKY